MFKFNRREDRRKVMAPVSGRVIKIEEVEDQMFSEKMLGDGIAIDCNEGKVYAPVSGTICAVVPSQHAFGIKTEDGFEILVHIGLETVTLKGEGFKMMKSMGDVVEQGELILKVDTDLISKKGLQLVSPVVSTNPSFEIQNICSEETVKANETVIFTY